MSKTLVCLDCDKEYDPRNPCTCSILSGNQYFIIKDNDEDA